MRRINDGDSARQVVIKRRTMMLPLCDQALATQLYENQQVTRAIAEACSQRAQDWADRTCPAKVKWARGHRVWHFYFCGNGLTVIFILCEEGEVFGAQSLQWAQWANYPWRGSGCTGACIHKSSMDSSCAEVRPSQTTCHGHGMKLSTYTWYTHLCANRWECIMHAA